VGDFLHLLDVPRACGVRAGQLFWRQGERFPNDFDKARRGALMGRWRHGGPICETCPSIDVRRWEREGKLLPGQSFEVAWAFDGERCAGIRVGTEWQAVVLMFRVQRAEGWEDIRQRVPLTWTPCHLGGCRPWFRCNVQTNGQYCGRRVVLLYSADGPFACRTCYGLPYASQRESLRHRGLTKARKIRARLGGSANMFDDFPDRPKGMHRRTYIRLRHSHDIAASRCGC
jgi:hypothetical protein